ncbi:MAG: HEAT repeat domain-containing protein [Actinomycetota bacterium]|nr:HEAT repeat domain-containing protein [Actinomycetota bacterium]
MGSEELRRALQDDDPFARAGALSRAGDSEDVLEVVAEALADDYPQVRREAVRALRRIGGPLSGRALADTLANDPSSEVREEAVAALAALLARRIRRQESGA